MSEQRRAAEDDWSNVDSVLKETRRNERVGAIVKETCTPRGKFNVIYADPPYRFESTLSECRAIENHYPTMTHDEICNLDIVPQIRADDAVLFLWSPAAKLKEAMAVIDAWDFVYRTGGVWDKVNIGMGYYFRLQRTSIDRDARRDAGAARASPQAVDIQIGAPGQQRKARLCSCADRNALSRVSQNRTVRPQGSERMDRVGFRSAAITGVALIVCHSR